jgi:hypothetical protein
MFAIGEALFAKKSFYIRARKKVEENVSEIDPT